MEINKEVTDIKEITTLKEIRNNVVNQLYQLLPNYEVAKLVATDINCPISSALIVVNGIVPKVDLYYKHYDNYYHVYKYSVIKDECAVEVLYCRKHKTENKTVDKWYKDHEHISFYKINNWDLITKAEFEDKAALVE